MATEKAAGVTKHGGVYYSSGAPASSPSGEAGRASSVVEAATPSVKLGASVAEREHAIKRGYAVYRKEAAGRTQYVGVKPEPTTEPRVKRIALGASVAEHEAAAKRGYVVVETERTGGRVSFIGYAPSEYQKVQKQQLRQEQLQTTRAKSVAAGRTELEGVEHRIEPLEAEYRREYRSLAKDETKDDFAKWIESKGTVLKRRKPIYEAYLRERAEGRVDVPKHISEYQKGITEYNKDIATYNKRLTQIVGIEKDIAAEKKGQFTETTVTRMKSIKLTPTKRVEKFKGKYVNPALEKVLAPISKTKQKFEGVVMGAAWAGTKAIYPKQVATIEKDPKRVEGLKKGVLHEYKEQTKIERAFFKGTSKGVVLAPVAIASSVAFTVEYAPTGATLLVKDPKTFAKVLGVGAGMTATSFKQNLSAEGFAGMGGEFFGSVAVFPAAARGVKWIKGKPQLKYVRLKSTSDYLAGKGTQPKDTIVWDTKTGKQVRVWKTTGEGTGTHIVEGTPYYKPHRFSRKIIKGTPVELKLESGIITESYYPRRVKFTGKVDDLYLPRYSVSAYKAKGQYFFRTQPIKRMKTIDLVKPAPKIKGNVYSVGDKGRTYSKAISETKVAGKPTVIIGDAEVGVIRPDYQKIGGKWYFTEERKGIGRMFMQTGKKKLTKVPYSLDDEFYGKVKIKEPSAFRYSKLSGKKTQLPLYPKATEAVGGEQAKTITSQMGGVTKGIITEKPLKYAPKSKSAQSYLALEGKLGLKRSAELGILAGVKPKYASTSKEKLLLPTRLKELYLGTELDTGLKTAPRLLPIQTVELKERTGLGTLRGLGFAQEQGQGKEQKLKPIQKMKFKDPAREVGRQVQIKTETPPPPPTFFPVGYMPKRKRYKKDEELGFVGLNVRVFPKFQSKKLNKILGVG